MAVVVPPQTMDILRRVLPNGAHIVWDAIEAARTGQAEGFSNFGVGWNDPGDFLLWDFHLQLIGGQWHLLVAATSDAEYGDYFPRS